MRFKILLMLALSMAMTVTGVEAKNSKVDSLMANMSVKDKVTQLFIISVNQNNSPERRAYQDSLVKMGVGGLIVMRGPVAPFMDRVNELQGMSEIPLLVTTDAEWGASMRFPEYMEYPRQWELGHLDNAGHLLYRMGRNVGRELKDLNIMVNFAPVADLASGSNNVTRNESRLFSIDHNKVAKYSLAYMKGMESAGISACAKHFPGFSGVRVDSHYKLPVSFNTREKIDTVELEPFRQMINAGIKMVMMGHLSLPNIDSTGIPMSISKKGVTGLLKEHLGFKGLVITDALQMGAVSNDFSAFASNIMAYRAGVDLMLMAGDVFETIQAIADSVECGAFPMAELDEKVRKILEFKAESGFFDKDYSPIVTDLDKKIESARRRDRKLIKQMTRRLEKSGYGRPISDWSDPTLLLNTQGLRVVRA